MTTDQDLITAVAAHVMGWHVFRLGEKVAVAKLPGIIEHEKYGFMRAEASEPWVSLDGSVHQNYSLIRAWRPLTDHNDAFEVMAAFPNWIVSREGADAGSEYEAELCGHGKPGLGMAFGDTFGRAVCLAALKAVGVRFTPPDDWRPASA